MEKKQLVKSTSGIRGVVGNGLDPIMITTYGAAFGTFLQKGKVVVGRDSRPTGDMVARAVVSGLVSAGIDVIDIGIVPTPTVEIAVKKLKAAGGICVTASHNPSEWNALKFFNRTGEFITPDEYKELDTIFNSGQFSYVAWNKIGDITTQSEWVDQHIKMTLALKTINRPAIKKRKFKVVVDAINGAGSIALPKLLGQLGVKVVRINCDGDGNFVHKPEPIPEHLGQLGRAVRKHKADLGLACDPDADRLVVVDETGKPVNEELTLTIAVKQVLKKSKGVTVINLSTSSATAAVAKALGSPVYFSKVGESNVVQMMREKKAVIGGEGNGGVIYPSFHAGRDSLVAAALVLSCLAEERQTVKGLVGTFPKYYIIKTKASLPDDFRERLARFETEAPSIMGPAEIDRRDGLRFDFDGGWVQIRTSNTEPIYRLIVETTDEQRTRALLQNVIDFFK